ncbi:AAA family ATPase [Nocardioides insulae]|uniref:AAA family ATPase n=1 Tax=Nocardioides insulae TaxID=394734 RepID=UPI00042824FB|nr:hypothetical protein [Nocardioides insulae]
MPVVTLILGAGAAWESQVLAVLDRHRAVAVLKRCVDVEDLLAAASSGQADAAVLGLEAPGIDATVVAQLQHHGVRPVAIVPGGLGAEVMAARATRVGLRTLVPEDDPDGVLEALTSADEPATVAPDLLEEAYAAPAASGSAQTGRVVAVWGPAGAPGRTLVATALAAELAARSKDTLLVDADPFGGAVAQCLGILDEVSGLLAAARLAASGELSERFLTIPRTIGPHLGVVTGLPRADRWTEVRAGALEQLLDQARRRGSTILDTGFCLEDDPAADLAGRPGRHHLTLTALDHADEIVVVGAADPVGLTRLARGLVELGERMSGTPVRVVVNRMRNSLGWSETAVAEMLTGVVGPVPLHVLPDDRTAVDRALVSGRTLVEAAPESPLASAVAGLADAVMPLSTRPRRRTGPGRERLRRALAGRSAR